MQPPTPLVWQAQSLREKKREGGHLAALGRQGSMLLATGLPTPTQAIRFTASALKTLSPVPSLWEAEPSLERMTRISRSYQETWAKRGPHSPEPGGKTEHGVQGHQQWHNPRGLAGGGWLCWASTEEGRI